MNNPILLWTARILCTLCAWTVSPAQSPMENAGVRTGLERSPDDFIAGVFEHAGPIECGTQGPLGRVCWTAVVVVDVIASRPTGGTPRTRLRVLAKGEPGQRPTGRTIAFLVPLENTGIYGGSYMTAYGREKYERFRQAVENAVTGKRPI